MRGWSHVINESFTGAGVPVLQTTMLQVLVLVQGEARYRLCLDWEPRRADLPSSLGTYEY